MLEKQQQKQPEAEEEEASEARVKTRFAASLTLGTS